MRYSVSIDLNKNLHVPYSFKGTEISKFLTVEKTYHPENYINAVTLSYDREAPGLIEKNWNNPIFNNQNSFFFIAGFVLFRNKKRKESPVPTPEEVHDIIVKHGKDHYKYIKGNYYIMLLNKASMTVDIYSSPMFMHPAYYSFQNNHLVFSNYIESFKSYLPLSVDKQGLVEFSLFDHCIHDRTLYNEIKAVQGGYLLHFQNEKKEESLIYDIANWFTNKPQKRKDALKEINQSLKTSINDWINSTDKFNASLTGGFDGRLNFSFIKPKDYKKLIARSYGMPGSSQISIPENIAAKLNFKYEPILLDSEFEDAFPQLGIQAINITCGVTGFNRAMYPYAYNRMKDYSRSCLLGQCDMIRPLYNNPAGVVFNEFTMAVFFNDYETFKKRVKTFSTTALIDSTLFTDEVIENIYNSIKTRYIDSYKQLNNNLQFYFFLLKESLMKYWHTEFHLVDIFVDDYVSFADLDYLELLFASEYAGIYKGLLAKNQLARKSPQDLYVDLMAINNDKLNYIKNDRHIKPGWLKYGKPGWVYAAIAKQIGAFKRRKINNDTFNAEKWMKLFLDTHKGEILKKTKFFNQQQITHAISQTNSDGGNSYRLNRMISLKLWLSKFEMI